MTKLKKKHRNAVGVMDDSLFSIKSVFDDTGIKVPGKTTRSKSFPNSACIRKVATQCVVTFYTSFMHYKEWLHCWRGLQSAWKGWPFEIFFQSRRAQGPWEGPYSHEQGNILLTYGIYSHEQLYQNNFIFPVATSARHMRRALFPWVR